MSLAALTYLACLILVGGACAILLNPRVDNRPLAAGLLVIPFLIRVLVMLLNEDVALIAAKGAGMRSIQEFDALSLGLTSWASLAGSSSFFLQTAINFPAFALFGAERDILLLTNCMIGALSGLAAFTYLTRLYSFTCGIVGWILVNLYPAAFQFSILGLRDPFVYLIVIAFICTLLALLAQSRRSAAFLHSSVLVLVLLAISSLRPELLPILAAGPAVLLLVKLRNMYLSIESPSLRVAIAISSLSALFALAIPTGTLLYRNTLAQIGATEVTSPVEIASAYAERRYERAAGGEGGGSLILPESTYRSLGPLERIGLQSLGIIILPYPWLITNTSRMFAALDSIFVILLIGVTLTSLRHVAWLHRIRGIDSLDRGTLPQSTHYWTLTIPFLIGVMLMGLLINNAGNAFRMRISLVPFLIITSAIGITARITISSLARPRPRRTAHDIAIGDLVRPYAQSDPFSP